MKLKNSILSASRQLKLSFIVIGGLALTVFLSGMAFAQNTVIVRRAELSVPFGTISGSLVVVSDQMVFMDEDRPESSFTIPRNDIRDFKTENEIIMVTTRRAIRVRAEDKTEFSFRLRDGSAEALALWAGSKSPTTTSAAATTTTTSDKQEKWVYNARHKHMFGLGSCTGKLIISRDRVVYESLENQEHTRQFLLTEIKKVKRSSPYRIEIDTFNRDDYDLELEGQGMDISVFKMLEEWISLSRQQP